MEYLTAMLLSTPGELLWIFRIVADRCWNFRLRVSLKFLGLLDFDLDFEESRFLTRPASYGVNLGLTSKGECHATISCAKIKCNDQLIVRIIDSARHNENYVWFGGRR